MFIPSKNHDIVFCIFVMSEVRNARRNVVEITSRVQRNVSSGLYQALVPVSVFSHSFVKCI